MGIGRGARGTRTTHLLGKIFEIDHENQLHRRKKFELDLEKPGFRGKRSPFQNPGDAPGMGYHLKKSCSY
jgi:hypothetical protein